MLPSTEDCQIVGTTHTLCHDDDGNSGQLAGNVGGQLAKGQKGVVVDSKPIGLLSDERELRGLLRLRADELVAVELAERVGRGSLNYSPSVIHRQIPLNVPDDGVPVLCLHVECAVRAHGARCGLDPSSATAATRR